MRRLLFSAVLAAALSLLCAADSTSAGDGQIDDLVAGLERIRLQAADDAAASRIDETVGMLRQVRREGRSHVTERNLEVEYNAFRRSPAYDFLDASEKSLLERIVNLSRDAAERRSGADEEELAAVAQKLEPFGGRFVRRAWNGSPPCVLEVGDLVLRKETTFLSNRFSEASSRDRRFSHVGIVAEAAGEVKIVTVGEGGVSMGGVDIVSWREFMRAAVDCAVYRFKDGDGVGGRIAQAAVKRLGLPFDSAFDLGTGDRLYCSELVRIAVNEAVGRPVVGTTKRDGFEYVAIDDCYLLNWMKVFDAHDAGHAVN